MDGCCLYQHVCYPKEGHLDSVYFSFRYVQKNMVNKPGGMIYDPRYYMIYDNVFEIHGGALDE